MTKAQGWKKYLKKEKKARKPSLFKLQRLMKLGRKKK